MKRCTMLIDLSLLLNSGAQSPIAERPIRMGFFHFPNNNLSIRKQCARDVGMYDPRRAKRRRRRSVFSGSTQSKVGGMARECGDRQTQGKKLRLWGLIEQMWGWGLAPGLSLLEDRRSRSVRLPVKRPRAYHRGPLRKRALPDSSVCICDRLLSRQRLRASDDLGGMLRAPLDRACSISRTAMGRRRDICTMSDTSGWPLEHRQTRSGALPCQSGVYDFCVCRRAAASRDPARALGLQAGRP